MVGTKLGALLVLSALLGAGLLSTGCASKGKGAKASDGLIESSRLIRVATKDLQSTMDSLENLRSKENVSLGNRFKSYSKNLDKLEKAAARVGATRTKMQREGDKYFDKWNQQIAKIKNEDLQTRSASRRAEIEGQLDQVSASFDELSESYRSLVDDLTDIHLLLRTDLTVGGVEDVDDVIDGALVKGADVLEGANALADTFEELGVRMSAG